MPSWNQRYMASPIILPKAAPTLKMGMRLPLGTANVEARMLKKNCKFKRIAMSVLTDPK
jgi:hypothetical protein